AFPFARGLASRSWELTLRKGGAFPHIGRPSRDLPPAACLLPPASRLLFAPCPLIISSLPEYFASGNSKNMKQKSLLISVLFLLVVSFNSSAQQPDPALLTTDTIF